MSEILERVARAIADAEGMNPDKLSHLYVDAAQAALDVMHDWYPIECAPQDDRIVICRGHRGNAAGPLVYAAKRTTMLLSLDGGPAYLRDNDGYGFVVSAHPTHWLPLPELQEELNP